MHLNNTLTEYGLISKVLHWLSAILLFIQIPLGFYLVDLDFGEERLTFENIHIIIGLTIFYLVIIRLVKNIINPTPKLNTSIFKKPTEDEVIVGPLGIKGDKQADLKAHGGSRKAIYAYSYKHYDHWGDCLKKNFSKSYGLMGENLTIDNFDEKEFYVNPTGNFVTGGPDGDVGVTGRKIIVDTYGGYAPHGGGAFSGKDCTKVDRSGAYMARYIAKNIVVSGLALNATVQLSYAIGIKEPVSLYVYCDGKVRNDISNWISKNIDLTPLGIIRKFDLFKLNLADTTNYGHFGKSYLPWEKTDIAKEFNF